MRLSSTLATSKYVLAGILLMSLYSVSHCQAADSTCSSKFPNCIQCNAGYLACTTCGPGYYLSAVGGQCQKCSTNCRQCTSTTCTQCDFDYYPLGANCDRCSIGCSVCSSNTVCSQCKSQYFLQSGRCTNCISGCETCKDTTGCVSCRPNYQLNGNTCKFVEPEKSASLASGAVAGISVGSIVCFVIIVVIIVCACRKQQLQKQALASAMATQQGNPSMLHGGESMQLKPHAGDNSAMMGSMARPMGGQAYGAPAMGFAPQQQPTYTPSPMMMMPPAQYGGMAGQPTFTPAVGQPMYGQAPPVFGIPGQPMPYGTTSPGQTQAGALPPGFGNM